MGDMYRRIFNQENFSEGSISTVCKAKHLLLFILIPLWMTTGLNAQSSFPFSYGVASGDANENSVVLWTRLDNQISLPFLFEWEVARDSLFRDVVANGNGLSETRAVHVLAENLPSEWLYYRFKAAGYVSPLGRTFIADEEREEIAFAAFSCADYQRGYFNVYKAALASNDFQYLLFLGDYYYDNAPNELAVDVQGREHIPDRLPRSAEDFERRWKQYRSDPDLQELHRHYPSYAIWDDHEFADDCWKDGGENISGEAWESLKANAIEAWYDWMPVRNRNQHYATENLGPVQLILTETRVTGRDELLAQDDPGLMDASRTLFGAEQEQWLANQSEDRPWKVLCSGVPVMPQLFDGVSVRPHAWDGYPAARERLEEWTASTNATLFALSGDMHAARISDLPSDNYDPELQSGTWGVEVTAPPVTSIVRSVPDSALFAQENGHIRYFQESHRGFVKLLFTVDEAYAQFTWVPDVLNNTDVEWTQGPAFRTQRMNPFFAEDPTASFSQNEVPLLASREGTVSGDRSAAFFFPNPAKEPSYLNVSLPIGEYNLSVYSAQGQLVHQASYRTNYAGVHTLPVQITDLETGSYLVLLEGEGVEVVERFVVME